MSTTRKRGEPFSTGDTVNGKTVEHPDSGGSIAKRLLYCSFCGEGEENFEILIVTQDDIKVCNKCVDICNTIISEFRESKRTG